MEIKFSQDIQDVINLIQSNGYEAYVVGGYVRDYIVGKSNYDVDITTSATTDVLVNILKKYKLNDSFTRFGNIKFMSGEYTVEITTFRKEYNYIGHRKPGKIEFTNSLDEDLVRRDFTINAICSDGNKIIDMFGGISDLKNKVIKTIGDADIRLEEDSLRILRALRFSSKYGLSIDSKLKESINKNHKYLSEISFFSRYKELKGILEGKGCIRVLKEYKKVLKDAFFLDDLKVCLLTNCSNLEEKVALFFYYSNINISNKYLCCRDLKFKEDKVNLKYKLKKYGKDKIVNTLYFRSNILKENKSEFKLVKKIIDDNECYSLKMLDIDGNDLLNMGIENSKIGNILNILLDAVIESKCKNEKKELLEYLKKYIGLEG